MTRDQLLAAAANIGAALAGLVVVALVARAAHGVLSRVMDKCAKDVR